MGTFAEAMEGVARGEVWINTNMEEYWFELESFDGERGMSGKREVLRCLLSDAPATKGQIFKEKFTPSQWDILSPEWFEDEHYEDVVRPGRKAVCDETILP